MAEQGLPGTRARSRRRATSTYVLIRTEPIGLAEFPSQPQPGSIRVTRRVGLTGGLGSPAALGIASASRSRQPIRAPLRQPRSGIVRPPGIGSPGASPPASPAHRGAIGLPTTGKLADLRFALEDKFGPIDEVRQEANIGPVISAELAQQAHPADRPRLDRHPGLDDIPLRGLPHGRDGHRRAASMT